MAKTEKGSYKKAIQEAYNNGYRAGWAAHEQIPKRFGSRSVAKVGFSRGMSAHKKSDKYIARSKK